MKEEKEEEQQSKAFVSLVVMNESCEPRRLILPTIRFDFFQSVNRADPQADKPPPRLSVDH